MAGERELGKEPGVLVNNKHQLAYFRWIWISRFQCYLFVINKMPENLEKTSEGDIELRPKYASILFLSIFKKILQL